MILELQEKHQLVVSDIKQIDCGVSLLGPKELVSNHPKSVVEARFSIQYSIACALIYGQITLNEYSDKKVQNPEIQAFMPRVKMTVDEELAKLGFIGTAPIKLKITLMSGEVIEAENDLAIGNPQKPFSDQDIRDKFMLCTQKVDSEIQEALFQQLLDFDSVEAVDKIIQKLAYS